MQKNSCGVREGPEGSEIHGIEIRQQKVEITLPEWRVLRLVARSGLVLIYLIILPWIGTTTVLHSSNTDPIPVPVLVPGRIFDHEKITTEDGSADITESIHSVQSDDLFFMPMVFLDLKRKGIFHPGAGKSVILGDTLYTHLRLPFLQQNRLDLIGIHSISSIVSNSVDFIFVTGQIQDSTVAFINRVLKIDGIIVIPLNADSFRLHPCYLPIYVRRFGSTIVAMRKTQCTSTAANIERSRVTEE